MEKTEGRALALGAFDGLHRGHMQVIDRAVAHKSRGLTPGVLTFSQDPSLWLEGHTDYLMTRDDKERILHSRGIEEIFNLHFEQVRNMPPKDFAEQKLFAQLNAKVLICGRDFRFGKNAGGNVDLLCELCQKKGIELNIIEPLMDEEQPISATRIRRALEEGDLSLAGRLLGRRFGFCFKVVEGNRIGRTLGTPTINQLLPRGFVRPRFGVYASLVYVQGMALCGVTNVGIKPTVGNYEPLFETWIPDFNRDMYGMEIRVELVEFLRDERKFAGLEALKAEIVKNAEQAKAICGRLNS